MDAEDEIVRLFLRDRPEFTPGVTLEPGAPGEPKYLYTAAAWSAFQSWARHCAKTWPLPKLRAAQRYFKESA